MNFQPLTKLLDSLEHEFHIPGNQCIVTHEHSVIYSHAAGFADREAGRRTAGTDIHLLWSVTKLSTCTAALQLTERGLLHPEDPVSDYLPEFEHLTVQEGERIVPAAVPVTVRHLMTMTAGFTYDKDTPQILQAREKYGKDASTRQMVSALAKTPLAFQPGTHYRYSMCHDILAAVIEVVSGLKFSEYLQKNIFDPLDMHEIWFEVPSALKSRIVPHYSYQPDIHRTVPIKDYCHRLSDGHESGGAGIFTTCDCYAKLVDALANNGEGATGAVILSGKSIELMKTNQLGAVSLSEFREPRFADYGYGLGVRTRMTSDGVVPVGEFGWDGAAGSFAMADTENRLAIFFTMQVLNYYPRLYEDIHPKIRELVYQCIK